jgi:Cd2+/Zn2+-exporting ATPase
MKQAVFTISKMDCPTEEQLIRNRLKPIPEIERLDFDLMSRELTVSHRLDDDKSILSALESLGLGAQRKASTPDAEGIATDEAHDHPATVPTATKVLLGVSGAAALAAEAVAWSTQNETAPLVIVLSLLSISAGGRDTLRKGIVALRTLTLNINFLMTLAVIGAVCIGQWPEAAMVTFLFGVAEMIEAFSLERARNAIRGLMEMTPETATVWDEHGGEGHWHERPSAEIQIGQRVRVKPGERIPLDGVLASGASTVNQAPITGESMPVEKKTGDTVFAGSINERGAFEFTVTSDKGHTTLARIIRAVQEAQAQRAPTQRFVDNFARYYTPAVVVLALLVAAVPPLFFGTAFSPWLYKALVMLVIACPCALVISTPITVVSGLAAAARRGILVKGGVYLEEGRKLRAVALDKTGTLTHGKPVVTDVVPLSTQDEEELLQLAASLDAPSEHPVASAIVAAWTKSDETPAGSTDTARLQSIVRSGELLPVEGFESITGHGAAGIIGGEKYFVGNHRLAEENKVCGPHVEEVLNRLEAEGKTTVVLTTDKEALAVLGVTDTLRETSIEALQALHELGVRSVMLTGDNATTARAIAAKVGIDDARGDLLPEDKLTVIDALLKECGHVGMVGDGINDAPALAKATVGFAMGAAGTDTAIETADVALMKDDLRKLPLFIRLSRQTGQVLAQNITLAIGIKVVFFILALMGKATLWMAVFADMGASLLVVFNGLRLLRFNLKS